MKVAVLTSSGLAWATVRSRSKAMPEKCAGMVLTNPPRFFQSTTTNEIRDVLLHNRIIIDICVSDLRTALIGAQMLADARSLMQDFIGQD